MTNTVPTKHTGVCQEITPRMRSQVEILDLGDALHIFQHLGHKPFVGIEFSLRQRLLCPLHGSVDGEEHQQSHQCYKPHAPVEQPISRR